MLMVPHKVHMALHQVYSVPQVNILLKTKMHHNKKPLLHHLKAMAHHLDLKDQSMAITIIMDLECHHPDLEWDHHLKAMDSECLPQECLDLPSMAIITDLECHHHQEKEMLLLLHQERKELQHHHHLQERKDLLLPHQAEEQLHHLHQAKKDPHHHQDSEWDQSTAITITDLEDHQDGGLECMGHQKVINMDLESHQKNSSIGEHKIMNKMNLLLQVHPLIMNQNLLLLLQIQKNNKSITDRKSVV